MKERIARWLDKPKPIGDLSVALVGSIIEDMINTTDMTDLMKLQLESYDGVNVKVIKFRVIFVISLAKSIIKWRRYRQLSERKSC